MSKLRDVFKLCYKHSLDVEFRNQAAVLSYTTLFSLVPILVISFSIIDLLPGFNKFADQVKQFLLSHIAIDSVDQVSGYLDNFINQAHSLSTLGIVFLFISSILLFFWD